MFCLVKFAKIEFVLSRFCLIFLEGKTVLKVMHCCYLLFNAFHLGFKQLFSSRCYLVFYVNTYNHSSVVYTELFTACNSPGSCFRSYTS